MKLYNGFLQYFLFIYFCYCHDLNHADPVTIKQSESPVTIDPLSKTIETTNIQKTDTIDTRFRTTHDLKKPIHESNQNEQSVQYTTPSVDISSQNQVPVSIQNDLTSPSPPVQTQTEPKLSTTETPSISNTIKNIPISTDKPNPKIIQNDVIPPVQTQINQQSIDKTQQNRLEDEILTLSSTQSHQQEQIKPISDHIPSPSNTQQPIQNSNSINQHSELPLKPTEIIINESHSSTTKLHHIHPRHVRTNQQQTEDISKTDTNQSENVTAEQSKDEHIESIDPTIENKSQTQTNIQNLNTIDLPRQVHVHNTISILDQPNTLTKEDSNKSENLIINKEIENATTIDSFLIHDNNLHLSRTTEIIINNSQINDTNNNETTQYFTQIESKIEENNNTIPLTSGMNNSDKILTNKNRQICWQLPKKFEPSIELLENQIFRFINVLPEFIQTILFGRIEDREILMNTIWLGSICTMCFLFSFLFLLMGTKRLKQSKYEKEIRTRCQQLQQYNNQIELERATFERQNQKLSNEIDELKTIPVRDTYEDIFTLREECTRFQQDIKTVRTERDILQHDIDYKQNLIQKYEYDIQGQVETIAYLNNQILQLKQELEKERDIRVRLQSNDLSLERFEKTQEIIQELKSEIIQLKQEKFTYKDQLQEIQEHINQLDIENNQLIFRMKQLKDLLEQREQIIKRIYNEKIIELEDLPLILNNNQHFLSIIDNDIEKSNQHIHDLHNEINEKTHRIKELDLLLKQEKDHYKEIETKLKIVLELRERDAHLHIRQLGQTDAELRKARTDTERVRILQQQLELKQQQLDDVQKVLSTEQIKFNEECSKLQHETHEKWMEVKRLTRELESSKKECEGLRRQITKYANNERSSQEKIIIKPVPQHIGYSGGSETNGSSPIPYQQAENFRPIDHLRNDSGAASPVEMLIPRPPIFNLSRPPFFPPPFMPRPPSNPFMMHPRFPISMTSPISQLIINGNDTNNSEIIDSSNITPNSMSYDAQSNEVIISPVIDDEKQIKTKKIKKSLKKKTRTSIVKEDV